MKCGRERKGPELNQQSHKQNNKTAKVLHRFGNAKCSTAFAIIYGDGK